MKISVKPWEKRHEIRFSPGVSSNKVLAEQVVDEKFVMNERFQHRTLRQRVVAFDGALNLSSEYDWGEPMGNEVW